MEAESYHGRQVDPTIYEPTRRHHSRLTAQLRYDDLRYRDEKWLCNVLDALKQPYKQGKRFCIYRVRQKNVYTLQRKKTLCCTLVLNLIIHHKLNTSYSRAQYKFPVPVQLMDIFKFDIPL